MIHEVTRSSMKKYFAVLRALRESNPRHHSANARRSDGLTNGADIPVDRNRPHPLHRPPDCHCQALLRKGLLTRAVNVVECTPLQDAVDARFARGGPKLRAAHLLFLPVFKAYSSHYSSASCPFYTARSIGRQFATSGAESVDTRAKGLYSPLTSFTE